MAKAPKTQSTTATLMAAALPWIVENYGITGDYNSDDLKDYLRTVFPELDNGSLTASGNSAFGNKVDWVTATMTKFGYHTKSEPKTYRLTTAGLVAAGGNQPSKIVKVLNPIVDIYGSKTNATTTRSDVNALIAQISNSLVAMNNDLAVLKQMVGA